MKLNKDLVTAIIAGTAGIIIAFMLTHFMLPEISPISFKKIQEDTKYELTEPDENVFNYRALNPTVEVYVGDCDKYDDYGNCLDEDDNIIEDNTENTDENITPSENEEPAEENENGSSN